MIVKDFLVFLAAYQHMDEFFGLFGGFEVMIVKDFLVFWNCNDSDDFKVGEALPTHQTRQFGINMTQCLVSGAWLGTAMTPIFKVGEALSN